ncbi:MAG TPA: sirohydrochlorin chelatase [Alphaproteobacteria bacterium]|nr:sirohydrochlorin chelatase [Alphaproteobacteria bacterium]
MSGKTGVMLCGHGSRDPSAIEEFGAVARKLRARLTQYDLEWGFLEFARPIIREGLDKLRARGCREILAVPGMLFAAGHVKNDVPSVLNRYQAEHPEVAIRLGRDLGIDPRMIEAAGASIAAALAQAGDRIARHDTMLMVVGRGTSDPDANSNIAKVMRLLWEGFGFGWGETAYSGVTFPLVAPALEHAARLGYRRIVVFPYFLFSGILVSRIYEHTDLVAARHPGIEFVKAAYLNDNPLVLDTFAARIEEILAGTGNMNCQMCKYRVQLLGFEDEVALPQESHHHHVEGIGTAADHHHTHHHDHGHGDEHHHHHGHGHDHGHSHAHDPGHHHPYPHADHPLGPTTLKALDAARQRGGGDD